VLPLDRNRELRPNVGFVQKHSSFSLTSSLIFSAMPEQSAQSQRGLARRRFLKTSVLAVASLASARVWSLKGAETRNMPFGNGERTLVKFPQKRPLILLTTRPPQLETPFSVFNEGVLTPNDAFFVRYHLANSAPSIEQLRPGKFRVAIKGSVKRPLTLSIADLKRDFEPVEVVAVNQCSGNSRGFSN